LLVCAKAVAHKTAKAAKMRGAAIVTEGRAKALGALGSYGGRYIVTSYCGAVRCGAVRCDTMRCNSCKRDRRAGGDGQKIRERGRKRDNCEVKNAKLSTLSQVSWRS